MNILEKIEEYIEKIMARHQQPALPDLEAWQLQHPTWEWDRSAAGKRAAKTTLLRHGYIGRPKGAK